MADWYERRDELKGGMVFTTFDGVVKLDRGVAGDATKWFVADWYQGHPNIKGYEKGHWSYEDGTIEPGDLVERLPDAWTGGTP